MYTACLLRILSEIKNIYLIDYCIVHIVVYLSTQGALDGGLDIPHSDKRFAGFSKDSKQLDVDVHRKYIFGGHVAAYMRVLPYINALYVFYLIP